MDSGVDGLTRANFGSSWSRQGLHNAGKFSERDISSLCFQSATVTLNLVDKGAGFRDRGTLSIAGDVLRTSSTTCLRIVSKVSYLSTIASYMGADWTPDIKARTDADQAIALIMLKGVVS